MGLDTIINAYYYTLTRLRRKKEELGPLEKAVKKEEAAEDMDLPVGEEELPFEEELKEAAKEAKNELEEEEEQESR